MMTIFTNDMKDEMRNRQCRDCLYFIPGICACSRGFQCCDWNEEKRTGHRRSSCTGCHYGKKESCIGVCMRDLLKEWREDRKEASVYA